MKWNTIESHVARLSPYDKGKHIKDVLDWCYETLSLAEKIVKETNYAKIDELTRSHISHEEREEQQRPLIDECRFLQNAVLELSKLRQDPKTRKAKQYRVFCEGIFKTLQEHKMLTLKKVHHFMACDSILKVIEASLEAKENGEQG